MHALRTYQRNAQALLKVMAQAKNTKTNVLLEASHRLVLSYTRIHIPKSSFDFGRRLSSADSLLLGRGNLINLSK